MEWTGARYADTPTVEVRRRIEASPRRVWELVTDITVMPRLSDELQAAEWEGETRGVGARFIGHNRHPAFGEWETTSHVVECTALHVFTWAVTDPEHPSAVWRFTLDALDDGATELTQWAQLAPGPSGLTVAIERMPEKEQKIVHVRLGEWESAMGATLDALKALAEGGSA